MPYPPCGPCQQEGGFRVKPGGQLYPPTESVPPYTGRQHLTGPAGERVGSLWEFEPMCAVHAHAMTEHVYRESVAVRAANAAQAKQSALGFDL